MSDTSSPDSGQPPSDASEEGARGIVGIGASAGGVEALSAFFDNLDDDIGLVYVVILHLMPDRESQLAEVLRRHTTMPVTEVQSTVSIEPDHVYLIPPGKALDLRDGELHLGSFETEDRPHSPIDRFFRTLAQVAGPKATGIVLSGTGSDGALGIKAIKEAGGLVMVQDSSEAAYSAMPRNALATGIVDVVRTVSGLAHTLRTYRERADIAELATAPETLPEDGAADLNKILTHVRSASGHDFTHYKRSTVLRRIARRMQICGAADFAGYQAVLEKDPSEPDTLVRDLLITVTSFFRDPEAFQTLEDEVIPGLFEGKTSANDVRVWVTGCATGEEAYSIAMLLVEHADRLDDPPSVQVFATDLSKEAISIARKGLYPDTIEASVSRDRLQRFFTREKDSYRVKDTLREVVLFAVHDLLSTPPFTRLDLISCRNLLIYLQREVQDPVFDLFHYALRSHGYLFLGMSETPVGPPDQFIAEHPSEHIYRRGPVTLATPRMPEMPLSGSVVTLGEVTPSVHPDVPFTPGEFHQRIVELYAPPSVLVNEDYDVLHFSEHVGRFLEQPGGVPTKNILEMVPEPVKLELRAALYNTFRRDNTVEAKLVRLGDGETARHIRVTVRSAKVLKGKTRYALILFEEVSLTDDAPEEHEVLDEWSSEAGEVISQLEDDLAATKEQLQTTVEQYETSNEELKSSNEELQSINEELKSATEELQTSREELQSTNEELVTVNEEYRAKIEELAQANSDLRNLMDATSIGIIFLDDALRLSRYTQAIEDIFNITRADLGRPLAHFTHRLAYAGLLADAERVLNDLQVVGREVQADDANGRWYLMRMRPYRTADDKVDGVVITFVDITEQKVAEERLEESQHRLAAIVENTLDVMLLADDNAQYVDCNRAATEVLGYTREELLQMGVQDTMANPKAEDCETTWAQFLLEETTEGEIVLQCKDGRLVDMEYRAVSDILPGLHLSVLRDITERKQREHILERQAKIIDEVHDAVIITDLDGVIVSVNRGGQEMIGYPEDELVGQHVSMVYAEDERALVNDKVIAPLKENGNHEAEVRIQRRSGEIRYAHLSLAMLHGESGLPTGMVVYAVGITERKEAEKALAAANRRISRILESISEGFFVVDADDRLTYVNDRALDFWQMRQEELIGRVVWEVLPEAMSVRFRNEYLKATKRQENTSFEAYFAPLKRWFAADLHPFEEGVSVYFRDVTERRRLEQEVIRIQEEEQRRIGRNLHDGLASLLTGLAMLGRGIANRIGRGDPVDLETVEELIRQARNGAEQARSLAHGLNPVKLEEQGLEAALRELSSTVQVLSNVNCSCIVDEDLPELRGAEHHLYRIAQEAALNAVRHAQGSRIDLRLQHDDGDVVLSVHDDGVGIDPEAAKKGGMGLHSMRYRAHLIGGNLTIQPAPEGGTDVVCRLPDSRLSIRINSPETDVE
ncbi:MAG: PAS domain S-box protein [Bacteroidetes bacterium]|jgi:two-component system CheB/CheR fusion protein|nr:PAS domain S-box protein [Bacteroidota bacterium]